MDDISGLQNLLITVFNECATKQLVISSNQCFDSLQNRPYTFDARFSQIHNALLEHLNNKVLNSNGFYDLFPFTISQIGDEVFLIDKYLNELDPFPHSYKEVLLFQAFSKGKNILFTGSHLSTQLFINRILNNLKSAWVLGGIAKSEEHQRFSSLKYKESQHIALGSPPIIVQQSKISMLENYLLNFNSVLAFVGPSSIEKTLLRFEWGKGDGQHKVLAAVDFVCQLSSDEQPGFIADLVKINLGEEGYVPEFINNEQNILEINNDEIIIPQASEKRKHSMHTQARRASIESDLQHLEERLNQKEKLPEITDDESTEVISKNAILAANFGLAPPPVPSNISPKEVLTEMNPTFAEALNIARKSNKE